MTRQLFAALAVSTLIALAGHPAAAQAPQGRGGQPAAPRPMGIDVATAKKMVAAAEAAAIAAMANVAIAVVDMNGIWYLERMDGASARAVTSSEGKARAALLFGMPTKQVQDLVAAGQPVVAKVTMPVAGAWELTPMQGGLPIMKDGKVVGAIGCGGSAPANDEKFAKRVWTHSESDSLRAGLSNEFAHGLPVGARIAWRRVVVIAAANREETLGSRSLFEQRLSLDERDDAVAVAVHHQSRSADVLHELGGGKAVGREQQQKRHQRRRAQQGSRVRNRRLQNQAVRRVNRCRVRGHGRAERSTPVHDRNLLSWPFPEALDHRIDVAIQTALVRMAGRAVPAVIECQRRIAPARCGRESVQIDKLPPLP